MPNDEKYFAHWLREVSVLIEARFGIGLDDLPDMATRDAFEGGSSPRQFFDEAVLPMMREEFGSEAVDGGGDQ